MNEKPPVKKGRATPVDAIIGHHLQQRRIYLGMSVAETAKQLGVSLQQLQKYENGDNRISASRLLDLAAILKSNAAEFLPSQMKNKNRLRDGATLEYTAPSMTKESKEFLRLFYGISDPKIKKSILNLLKTLSEK